MVHCTVSPMRWPSVTARPGRGADQLSANLLIIFGDIIYYQWLALSREHFGPSSSQFRSACRLVHRSSQPSRWQRRFEPGGDQLVAVTNSPGPIHHENFKLLFFDIVADV